MPPSRRIWRWARLFALWATFTTTPVSLFRATAQVPTGEIHFEVKDPTGAAVIADGRLQNLTTGLDQRFQTDAEGAYRFEKLAYGRYRLSVSKSGFTTQSIDLDVKSSTVIERTVILSVGAPTYSVNVVTASPLSGMDRTLDEIPAPVQTASSADIEASGAVNLSDFLNRRMSGVYLNEIQGNPAQPDLNYRGYTASPLLGTPQGISVYMDGVRLNQPFGDVVSWDLIPQIAIAETTLIPGSNPLFGLNTLGGAVSLQTKDGRSHPGTALELSGGSFGRIMADLEHGGSNSKGLSWYGATNFLFENGWREASPSNVRQFFGRLGWQGTKTILSLTGSYANNLLSGNGLQDTRFFNQNYSSIYTKPDSTGNRSPFINLTARQILSSRASFTGNTYYRYIRTNALNSDINQGSLDQSVYQPTPAERAILAQNGYPDVPAFGLNATNTPFPFLRCIANALLQDEPAEKCNGLLNRTHILQRNFGLSGQVNLFPSAVSRRNQFTIGGAWDGNSVSFQQLTELGYLNPDHSVTGVGVFGDGVTGGSVDGEPFDTQVHLKGTIYTSSAFATDTLRVGSAWSFTFSGRYNRTVVDNTDVLRPSGTGSLTGRHTFDRFNPAAGVTYRPRGSWSLYFGYSEGNRAPTSVELGCADPNLPCKLPNAMAGDPPLKQVVTRTIEAGIRGGSEQQFRWSAGYFRASNHDDILFVSAPQTGFGYFRNFGNTLRQGAELDAHGRIRRVTAGVSYTFLDATFQSPETVNGSGNSANADAIAGVPGVESTIDITVGDRVPLIPQQMVKAYADIAVTSKLTFDLNVIGISSAFARGNENNQHQPDGTYYLGPGSSPGYGIVNLGVRYQLHRRAELFVRVNNLFDRKYYTAAQLGSTGFTASGNFIARPFPPVNGQFPVQQGTFFAPGAPTGVWGGIKLRF
jgi:outer membrane receptor protein involved in Fe transport